MRKRLLYGNVIRSINEKDSFNWHIAGKDGKSLRCPWISISRTWLKVDALATEKLGNGCGIAFWLDTLESEVPFNFLFPRLYKVALLPKGSVADSWESSLASWSIAFQQLLKEEEILEFQVLLRKIAARLISDDFDKRSWSLMGNGVFSVKSFSVHLSSSSPMDKLLYLVLWKSNIPRMVNILVWIMMIGHLNVAILGAMEV